MPDFGDDIGQMFTDNAQKVLKNLFDVLKKSKQVDEPNLCSVTIHDPEQMKALAKALNEINFPFEVKNTFDLGEDGQMHEKFAFTFKEESYDTVRNAAKKIGIDLPKEPPEQGGNNERDAPVRELTERDTCMRDIEAIVKDAYEKSGDNFEAFTAECKAQGLDVTLTADGTPKFVHPNGWFEVRADTLGERMGQKLEFSKEDQNRDAFERGVGEKAQDDLSQMSVEEQERYIQSHDGMDVDTRTRVVESVTRAEPNDAHGAKEKDFSGADKEYKKYDFSGSEFMRYQHDTASEAKEAGNAGREEISISPQER